ncbi:MAG TPA: multicopper oxidase domain-containing protein [Chitinophagaceae bacterium]|nr:multicopper oxidase domain-containing protein [Chitinophagaceae bacterium]
MKNLLAILIQVLLITSTSGQTTKVIYTCPMHPEVKMIKPGNCPKCGMTLVKKTIKVAAPKPASKNVEEKPKPTNTRPVQKDEHKDMRMDKPIPEQQKTEPSQTKVIYTCVMHPEVQQDKPGNCPKCGMTLIKKTIKVDPAKTTGKQDKQMDMDQHNHEKENKRDDAIADEFIGNNVNMLPGRIIVYHLYVTDTIVNYTSKLKHAYAVNGTIPAPALVFTEGDTAEIYLHNKLKNEETSLHWHGVILPNRFDGVPYLTTARIGPGETHLYKFRVVQNGTYWYHSHSKLQEQAGMYGALVFKKREDAGSGKDNAFNAEYNLVLSDWTDEKPSEVQRRLRTANDWYAIKKGSTQSYAEAIKEGYFKTKFVNEWKRMKAMDVSDVYYDRFLSNGKPVNEVPQFKAGDKVRLRIVNAGASSYFWVQYAGGKLTVIANDGNEVEPVEVDRLIVGVAETYDVVVTIPANMSYEFKATPEDRTKSTSLWLGSGMKMPAPELPKLKYFEGMKMMNSMMKTNGDMKDMGMQMSNQTMDMNMVMYPEITGDTKAESVALDSSKHMQHDMEGMDMSSSDIVTLNYAMLKSPVKTTLPAVPVKELHFTLTGNMNRYVWSINNKVVNEWDKILIKQGENVRITLFNNSMMRHPMHLHGHDFRVLNGQGEYAPLKNVLDIMPMETDTIEFAGNQSGNWFFHCHILYHMMAGMGNVFTYLNSPANPELPDAAKAFRAFKKDNHMIHAMAKIGLESNGTDGEAMLSTTRYALQGMWHLGYKPHHGYEAELNLGRFIGRNQWLFPYIGFDYHYKMEAEMEKTLFGQISNKNDRKTFVAGIQYTLPWLAIAEARIDGNGKFRFQLSREDIPVTSRLRFNFMYNTDKEYMAGFRYIISKWFAVSTHYDSDMAAGAGITITY